MLMLNNYLHECWSSWKGQQHYVVLNLACFFYLSRLPGHVHTMIKRSFTHTVLNKKILAKNWQGKPALYLVLWHSTEVNSLLR